MSEGSYSWGTTWILLGRAAGYVISMAGSVLVARMLGVERLGLYAYAMSIAAFFGLLPHLGISTVVTRAVARDPRSAAAMASAAVCLQALLAVGVAAVIIGFGAILPEQPVPLEYIALAAGQLVVGTMSWPYLAVLGGRAQYGRVALAELLTGLAGLLMLVVAAVAGGGVAEFLWAHVGAAVAAIGVARWAAVPFLEGPRAGQRAIPALLREALPFGAMTLVQSFYMRLDMVLLGQLSSPVAVGLYSVASKPVAMVVNIGAAASGTLFPFLVQEEGATRLHRVLRLFAVVVPGVALVLCGLSGVVIDWLYGPGYREAAPLLTVLAWSAVASWLSAPLGVALQAKGFERGWLAVLSLGLALNAAGNLWLIPRWGALGTAVTMLVSEAVLTGTGAWLAGRLLRTLPFPAALWGIAGSAAVGGLVLWSLRSAGAVVATLAAVVIYSGLLFLWRAVTIQDLATVLGRFREAFASVRSGGTVRRTWNA